jgi:hypothetical protein
VTFSNRSWDERVKVGGMGDLAEAKFEEVYPNGFVRTGLDRPPLQVYKLPLRERYRPDYLTSTHYVEVQGFGKKQTMALKVEKYNCLQFWQQVFPVKLFIYDSYYERYTFVWLRDVDRWINCGKVQLRYFPEGKAYFLIPADVIFAPDQEQ